MLRVRLSATLAMGMSLSTFACSSSDDTAPGAPTQAGGSGGSGGSGGLGGEMTSMGGSAMENGDDAFTWPDGHADPCNPLPDTAYLNDELCLQPPPPDIGYQLHFGPQDYDNPDDVNQFLLEPGGEDLTCVYDTTGNTVERHIKAEHTRLRSGTHHMIVWAATGPVEGLPPDGTYDPNGCSNFLGIFHTGAQAGLSERGGILDIPLPADTDAEDSSASLGYARLVRPETSVNIDLHYVNATQEPILKEAWINEIYADESQVTKTLDPIFFLGGLGMNVQPGTTEVVGVDQCTLPPHSPNEARIMGISGHAHSHTSRITAWVNWADGSRETVYETFDWAEPLNAGFDSTHTYPAPNGQDDGAHTGPLELTAGDTFGWECEVTNDDLDFPLRFANEAYTGEMCNIFGFYVPGDGGMWSCGLNSGAPF